MRRTVILHLIATLCMFVSCTKCDIANYNTSSCNSNITKNINKEVESTIEDMYDVTFNHIISTSGKKADDYFVSNDTYNLGRWMFSHELDDVPEIRAKINSFVERNKFDLELRVKKNALPFFTNEINNPKYIIFYSEIIDNMIVANVFPLVHTSGRINNINSFEEVSRFNTSRNYLFIFEHNQLKKIVTAEMIYD